MVLKPTHEKYSTGKATLTRFEIIFMKVLIKGGATYMDEL